MRENVITFPGSPKAIEAASPGESKATIASNLQIRSCSLVPFPATASQKRSHPAKAAFPKMAALTGRVSTDISLNERLRKERGRRWGAASAKAEVLRAMMEMHIKISIAQKYALPEMQGCPATDPAEYPRLVENWRRARLEQLLTPAPTMTLLVWKRECVARMNNEYDWAGVKPSRIEKALAEDEAFLKAHPTRHCRHRPK